MEKVQAIGNEKNKIREAVMDVMESKLQAQFAQKAAQGQAPAVAKWLREEKISWNQFLRKIFLLDLKSMLKSGKKCKENPHILRAKINIFKKFFFDWTMKKNNKISVLDSDKSVFEHLITEKKIKIALFYPFFSLLFHKIMYLIYDNV